MRDPDRTPTVFEICVIATLLMALAYFIYLGLMHPDYFE